MTQPEVTQLSAQVAFADNTVAPVLPLNQQTLGQHDEQLLVPTYDRAGLTPARARPAEQLLDAGVLTVVDSWTALSTMLLPTLSARVLR